MSDPVNPKIELLQRHASLAVEVDDISNKINSTKTAAAKAVMELREQSAAKRAEIAMIKESLRNLEAAKSRDDKSA